MDVRGCNERDASVDGVVFAFNLPPLVSITLFLKMPDIVPTHLHRVFNQSLLSRRAMTDDMMLEMYKRSVKAVAGTSLHLPAPSSAGQPLSS